MTGLGAYAFCSFVPSHSVVPESVKSETPVIPPGYLAQLGMTLFCQRRHPEQSEGSSVDIKNTLMYSLKNYCQSTIF